MPMQKLLEVVYVHVDMIHEHLVLKIPLDLFSMTLQVQ